MFERAACYTVTRFLHELCSSVTICRICTFVTSWRTRVYKRPGPSNITAGTRVEGCSPTSGNLNFSPPPHSATPKLNDSDNSIRSTCLQIREAELGSTKSQSEEGERSLAETCNQSTPMARLRICGQYVQPGFGEPLTCTDLFASLAISVSTRTQTRKKRARMGRSRTVRMVAHRKKK